MGDTSSTPDYGSFNEAVAEEMFGLDKAGRPVYMLPDASIYESIYKRAGAQSGDAGRAAFLAAVRRTLVLDNEGVNPFKGHLDGCIRHRRNEIETPPALALLVVLSAAADVMHAGDGMAANNYYGRLVTLLSVPDWRQERFKTAYQGVAEDLWGSLNAWLESWEGERGVPTAYAVGQRFIGLPMSQALVRQHDRERLTQVFAAEGLPPGYQMAASDMEAVLDGWMSRQPPVLSNALRILWGNAAARERIAGVACLELETWRGETASGGDAGPASRHASVRLMAQVRTFPRPSVELNLTIPTSTGSDRPTATLAGADGPITMRLAPAGPGSLRFEDSRGLEPGSLLADEVSLTVADSPHAMTRLPRRLVPMRLDDLQNCFVEVERVQLGEQSLLMAAETLRSKVDAVLAVVARPGWAVLDTTTGGVPDGWLIYRGVQVFDRFTGIVHMDLQPLLPRSSATLVLSGGFSLPGRLRKWSSLDPPEIQAVTPNASRLKVRVDAGNRVGQPVLEHDVEASFAVVPLKQAALQDGEYLVTLWVDDARKPSATTLLRLRSGETPVRELASRSSGLVYRPSAGPLWPLSACSPDGSPEIVGARASVPAAGCATLDMPPVRQRTPPRAPETARRLVRVGRGLGDDSCMRTGMHRILLPPVLPDRPAASSVEGECTTCGLVKRYPGTAYGARRRVTAAPSASISLSSLPPVAEDDERDHAVAFDGLCHLCSGTASEFTRIASQVEGTALFVDVLLRRLELLGHIDVQRHDGSLALREFEVTYSTLVEIGHHHWWLVGCAPHGLVAALARAVAAHGGIFQETSDQGVPRRTIRCTRDDLDVLLGSDDRLADVRAITAAGPSVASGLPPLTSVAEALPRTPVPAFDALAQWDTASARWVPATSVGRAGAYRLGGFAPLYGVRSPKDLEAGTIAFAGPQLTKHVANLWAGDPLTGYHEASSSVVVPLGCDLPGLYGRSLALCSGKVPVVAEKARMLQYPGVPKDVAALVHTRMSR